MRTFGPAHARHITKECNKRQPILLTILESTYFALVSFIRFLVRRIIGKGGND